MTRRDNITRWRAKGLWMDVFQLLGVVPGLTHHNSESGLVGKPCLLVKSKLFDHIFATFR